jgi:hypothetical protein
MPLSAQVEVPVCAHLLTALSAPVTTPLTAMIRPRGAITAPVMVSALPAPRMRRPLSYRTCASGLGAIASGGSGCPGWPG